MTKKPSRAKPKPAPPDPIPPDTPRGLDPEAAEVRIEYLDLDKLEPALVNPKLHDLDEIEASFAAHGVYQVIGAIDERTGRLVAGHGRVAALKQRRTRGGREAPAGVRIGAGSEWLVPIARGWRSKDDDEATAVVVADNRLTELGGNDNRKLVEVLEALKVKAPAGLHGTGYDDAALKALLAKLAEPVKPAPVDLGKLVGKTSTSVVVPLELEDAFKTQIARRVTAIDDPDLAARRIAAWRLVIAWLASQDDAALREAALRR